jgi:hypothetical protein
MTLLFSDIRGLPDESILLLRMLLMSLLMEPRWLWLCAPLCNLYSPDTLYEYRRSHGPV